MDLNDFHPECVNKFNNECAIKFEYFQCRSSQHSFAFPTLCVHIFRTKTLYYKMNRPTPQHTLEATNTQCDHFSQSMNCFQGKTKHNHCLHLKVREIESPRFRILHRGKS